MVDLPLPYLALVLASVTVFAIALAVIGGCLIEAWLDHRDDNRTLAEIPDPWGRR